VLAPRHVLSAAYNAQLPRGYQPQSKAVRTAERVDEVEPSVREAVEL